MAFNVPRACSYGLLNRCRRTESWLIGTKGNLAQWQQLGGELPVVHRARTPLVLGIALHLDRVLTGLREAADPDIWWTTAGTIADHMVAGSGTPDRWDQRTII